jgi:hypothetical protein
MSLRSLEDRWIDHRAQVTVMHADTLERAEGCGDTGKARELHAQVRALAWVLDRLDAADRNGPVEPL